MEDLKIYGFNAIALAISITEINPYLQTISLLLAIGYTIISISNGVAKEIRHYVGSLFIFLFVIGLIVALIQFPVLDTNKEVVMMLIGTISASIGITVATITGSKPDDINSLKQSLEKKEHQIEMLVAAKDNLEGMVIDLQKQMLENQDNMMDKIILKAAMDFDDKHNPPKNK
jgi:heme/copper-type cytochrome/quinol oxidase subunit 4